MRVDSGTRLTHPARGVLANYRATLCARTARSDIGIVLTKFKHGVFSSTSELQYTKGDQQYSGSQQH